MTGRTDADTSAECERRVLPLRIRHSAARSGRDAEGRDSAPRRVSCVASPDRHTAVSGPRVRVRPVAARERHRCPSTSPSQDATDPGHGLLTVSSDPPVVTLIHVSDVGRNTGLSGPALSGWRAPRVLLWTGGIPGSGLPAGGCRVRVGISGGHGRDHRLGRSGRRAWPRLGRRGHDRGERRWHCRNRHARRSDVERRIPIDRGLLRRRERNLHAPSETR